MSRAMKDSGVAWIGEIPESWKVRKFKNLFQIKKDIAGTLGYDVLSITQKGIKVKDITKNEGQLAQDYSKYQLVYPNDFAMNHMDLLTGYVDCSKQIGVTSPDYRTFKAIDKNETVNEYYLRIFQFCYTDAIFYKLGQGVSNLGRWRLPADQQNWFPLPLPSPKEQQAIADFLDVKCVEVDELIALQEKMIEELKLYKQSVITEAVTKGLNPDTPMKDSGIGWVGQMPEHWDNIKTLYCLSMPITDGPHETPELFDDGIPFISAEAISKGYIDFESKRGYISEEFYKECCKKYIPKKNDIYMIKSGATTGRTAIVLTDKIFTIWSPLAVFRAKESVVYPLFLLNVLRSEYYLKQVENKWSYGTQQNIGMRVLETLKIALPPIEEQHQIADYLHQKCDEIDKLANIKQQKIDKLKEYKKSIIYEYVTGKKQVKI